MVSTPIYPSRIPIRFAYRMWMSAPDILVGKTYLQRWLN